MRYLLALLLLFMGSATASSQTVATGREGPLKAGTLYYVTFSCSTDLARARGTLGGFLGLGGYQSATHFFSLTAEDNDLSDGKIERRDSVKFVHVFSNNSGNVIKQDCRGQLLMNGSDLPKVTVYFKRTKKHLPDTAIRTIVLLKDLSSPFLRLVRGDEAADKDKEAVAEAGKILTSYEAYLRLFENEVNSDTIERPLAVGTNLIRTDASTVRISVKPVNGCVLSSSVPFSKLYDKLVDFQFSVDKKSPHDACVDFLSAIRRAGFTHFDDRAYILYHEDLFTEKEKYLECLQADDLVPSMLENRRFYSDLPKSIVITRADFDRYVSEPIALARAATRDADLRPRVEALVDLLGRFGKQKGIVPDDRPEFDKLAADLVEVNDKTDEALISPKVESSADLKTITTGTIDAGLKRLTDAGYSQFGCYHLVRSASGLESYDGAEAMILAGLPDDTDKKRTLGLRLIFDDDRRLVKVLVTQRLVPTLRTSVAGCSL